MLAEALERFAADRRSVLLGTQMVAKGHHFAGVELAAVVDADTGLAFPDFRAEERTFQLVTQLAGRSGRDAPGRVVVQTLQPDARRSASPLATTWPVPRGGARAAARARVSAVPAPRAYPRHGRDRRRAAASAGGAGARSSAARSTRALRRSPAARAATGRSSSQDRAAGRARRAGGAGARGGRAGDAEGRPDRRRRRRSAEPLNTLIARRADDRAWASHATSELDAENARRGGGSRSRRSASGPTRCCAASAARSRTFDDDLRRLVERMSELMARRARGRPRGQPGGRPPPPVRLPIEEGEAPVAVVNPRSSIRARSRERRRGLPLAPGRARAGRAAGDGDARGARRRRRAVRLELEGSTRASSSTSSTTSTAC